jgi:glyoxylase-like metal-dependent hydrolase (beta-lactamase superfamily II)
VTNDAKFLARRRIGAVETWLVDNGSMEWLPSGFDGGKQAWRVEGTALTADGRAILGLNGLIIRTTAYVVVVDPNELTPDTVIGTSTVHPGASISDALRELGLTPADVTHVAITHGHFDHFTAAQEHGEVRFANAEYLFPARDWRHFVEQNALGMAEKVRGQLDAVRRAGRLRLVEADTRIVAGVDMLETPGESPGHMVVRLISEEERLYYLGDLVHFPAEFDHLDWVGIADRDVAEMVSSRLRVLADASDADSTFVFTHGRFPAWGRVEAVNGMYRWRWD